MERPSSVLYLTVAPELKNVLQTCASKLGLRLNEFVAATLADSLQRPELADIPRKKMGRPRKPRPVDGSR